MRAWSRLLDLLFPPRATEQTVRDTTPGDLAQFLKPRTIELPDGTEATALLPFGDPTVHALIVEAKYYGNTEAHALLGAVLSDYLVERSSQESTFQSGKRFLVPVPLSSRRRKERGYNQVEEICREALPANSEWALRTHILERIRDTRSQTDLARGERLQNVSGAFVAHSIVPGTEYLVVDDVLTTGATLAAACTALRDAGAPTVSSLALAYSLRK